MLKKIYNKVTHEWDTSVEEALKSFIRLPALSPDFDKKWEENGVLLKALEDAQAWAEKQGIKGLRCEIIKDDGFTPCLFVEVDATSDKKFERSVFFYGHLDKQPPNEGWDQDKSAWEPVIQNGRLYGRGAVDDGYAFYTSLAAVKALQTLGIPHPRCVGLFETCEAVFLPPLRIVFKGSRTEARRYRTGDRFGQLLRRLRQTLGDFLAQRHARGHD